MKRLLPGLCFVLSISLLGVSVAQQSPGFIHVDEIQPGMKGYGLSVLRGTEPQTLGLVTRRAASYSLLTSGGGRPKSGGTKSPGRGGKGGGKKSPGRSKSPKGKKGKKK